MSGYVTAKVDSGANYARLQYSRGTIRPSTATKASSATIKASCSWSALAHCTKETAGKWVLRLDEEKHLYHGPQEYVDKAKKVVAKWAAHTICKTLNFGLRTTSSTERWHRHVKTYLGHGMGNLLYLIEANNAAIEDAARAFRDEEGKQKIAALTKYNGQKWLGKLPRQVARAALDLLAIEHQKALKMLRKEAPRGYCRPPEASSSNSRPSGYCCAVYTQYGVIYANCIADKEEASLPLEKSNLHKAWYLDCDLCVENPLLSVLSPKKVTATKGRPREIATFASDEEGVFEKRGKAIMGKKTTSTTTSLGSRAGDKTRSLDEEDARGGDAQHAGVPPKQQPARRVTKKATQQPRKRGAPADITKTSEAGTPSSTRSGAKRQRTAAIRSINQLPRVDLTVGDIVGDDIGDGGDGEEEEEILDEIVVRTD
ncbi:hypothetical protein F5883DRAFT_641116 [Diaporthe sp. PMI_573]|nr:hypothetical protein F5883DRAFT_641116 [Diaporthaceae sp. PMI_573]